MSDLEEHYRAHGTIVDHTDPAEVGRWIDLVHNCGRLRCPYLRLECDALGIDAVNLLFKHTHRAGLNLSEPGQYATIAGGMLKPIRPMVYPRSELWWVRNNRRIAAHAPRCTPDGQCPDCAEGYPCPLDIAHEVAAESLLLEKDGTLSTRRIDVVIVNRARPKGLLARWTKTAPDVAAHVAYLIIKRAEDNGDHGQAATNARHARQLGLHLIEPRLAVRHAQTLIAQGHIREAEETLVAARVTPSTNPGQRMLAAALGRLGSETAVGDVGAQDPRFVRLRRPPGRIQTRRFTRR